MRDRNISLRAASPPPPSARGRARPAAVTRPAPPGRDPAWPVAQACEYFTASGIPCTPDQLEAIIAQLPRFTPAGRVPPGPRGGRGKYVYPMSELMDLTAKLARWL